MSAAAVAVGGSQPAGSTCPSPRRPNHPPSSPCLSPQAVVDPLKFIGVRRCYDAHSLLRLLDELAAQQAQQAAQQPGGEQPGGPQPAQQQPGGLQDVQQQPAPSPQQQQQQHVPTAGGAPSGMLRRRLDDLPVELLVVDCLSAVITPVLGGGAGQHSVGHALLAAAAVGLKAFAAGGNAGAAGWSVGGKLECRGGSRGCCSRSRMASGQARPSGRLAMPCYLKESNTLLPSAPPPCSRAGDKPHGGRQRRAAE